jgi:hypothetical protein
MIELHPLTPRLLAVIPARGRLTLEQAIRKGDLPSSPALTAARLLERRKLLRIRTHNLLELTDSGRAFQAQLLSQEGRAA